MRISATQKDSYIVLINITGELYWVWVGRWGGVMCEIPVSNRNVIKDMKKQIKCRPCQYWMNKVADWSGLVIRVW